MCQRIHIEDVIYYGLMLHKICSTINGFVIETHSCVWVVMDEFYFVTTRYFVGILQNIALIKKILFRTNFVSYHVVYSRRYCDCVQHGLQMCTEDSQNICQF